MAKDPLVMSDVVSAQLVECEPDAPQTEPMPTTPEPTSPTQQAMAATIAQTGADPPPSDLQSPRLSCHQEPS